jgi:pilus assembly protein CpaC
MFDRIYALGALCSALWVTGICSTASADPPAGKVLADFAESAVQELQLQVGEQRVLPTKNVQSYSEGVKGVIDVRLTKDASQFVVVAVGAGTTTLLFIMSDGTQRQYRVTVLDPEGKKGSRSPGNVEARENIRLDFYFVQLNKTYSHKIGIGWPGAIAPTFSAAYDFKASGLDSATAVVTGLALPRLDIGQSTGWAKVMRQAAVVAANGEKASFSGGGEVNVLVQSALNTGVQKIPFGSNIEVLPTYDAKSGRIELQLHADISELQSDSGTGVPGRLTSGLDTVVNLELGQSIILAGLTAKSERTSKTGLPGLSQIPLIGVLFGSHGHSEDETENVVLIVPSVVDAVSMQARERIAEGLQQYQEFSGKFSGVKLVPERKVGGSVSAPEGKRQP